jgi:hypothetical protein
MKKIILTILFISTLFSSIWLTNANNRWEIDKILNLKFWVEQIEYKLSELPKKIFKNKAVQNKYNYFKKINKILTSKFYDEYKAWNIDYYTTKWIILNHQKFIYNTTKLFEYIEIKLENPKSKITQREINEKIINSYSQMRINYNRINFLFHRSKKR